MYIHPTFRMNWCCRQRCLVQSVQTRTLISTTKILRKFKGPPALKEFQFSLKFSKSILQIVLFFFRDCIIFFYVSELLILYIMVELKKKTGNLAKETTQMCVKIKLGCLVQVMTLVERAKRPIFSLINSLGHIQGLITREITLPHIQDYFFLKEKILGNYGRVFLISISVVIRSRIYNK